MPRMWKKVKQYERHFLLALVIILLATFSISGTLRGCAGDSIDPNQRDDGGSLEAAPGKRVEISSEQFTAIHWRYWPIYSSPFWGPSIKYGAEVSSGLQEDRMGASAATWTHIAMVEAAKAAGYAVGDEELQNAIRDLVVRGRGNAVQFSTELYDKVLKDHYHFERMSRSKSEFETTIREILLKDKFLTPLVDSMRFSRSRKDAYADWKSSQEHMELDYVGVPAAQFLDRVTKEEATRTTIAKQEEALADAVRAAPMVARVARVAKEFQQKNGAPAKDADELKTKEPGAALLSGKIPDDPWKKPIAYVAKDGGFEVKSLGKDGKEGGGDDVGPEVSDVVSTLGTLRTVSDALLTWKKTTEAWPDAIEKLTTAPPGKSGAKTVPPLVTVPKDAWSRELVYEAAGPVLLSTGADGLRGTADDLAAAFEADEKDGSRVRIPLPATLDAFVDAKAVDAWGKPILRSFKPGSSTGFDVVSAGEDGAFRTEDDLTGGNGMDVQIFYYQVQNRPEFSVPWKREFESLWAILPLVSDEALKRAWEKNPEWRPDEREAYDHWRQRQVLYKVRETEEATSAAIDPADPVKGHGVEVIEELKTAGIIPATQKGVLVPAAADFGDRGEAPKEGPAPSSDPQYRLYVDKGWRLVVLREMFFERMFNKALQDARKSKDEIEKWNKKGRPGGKSPEEATFTTFLARIAEFQPSQADHAAGVRFVEYYKPETAMTREQIEKFVPLADTNVSVLMNSLKDDAYSLIPTPTKRSVGRAIFHVTKYHPDRREELVDVRDTKVMPLYLQSRALDRAAKELDRVRTEAVAAKPPPKIADLTKAAAEKRKFEFFTGSTGPLIAGVPAAEPEIPEGMAPDEIDRLRRRARVRKEGAETIDTGGGVGAVGRRVIRDDPDWQRDPRFEDPGDPDGKPDTSSKSTHAAYLVQVASRADPEPSEMNARRYVNWLREAAYGDDPSARRQTPMTQRKGFLTLDLVRWFVSWDDIKHQFQIRTNRPIELPTPAAR
jgi:hypothetical protein